MGKEIVPANERLVSLGTDGFKNGFDTINRDRAARSEPLRKLLGYRTVMRE